MGLDEYLRVIKDIERMNKVYNQVLDTRAREFYSQYVNLVIEQLDFSFEEKSDLRNYWRKLTDDTR